MHKHLRILLRKFMIPHNLNYTIPHAYHMSIITTRHAPRTYSIKKNPRPDKSDDSCRRFVELFHESFSPSMMLKFDILMQKQQTIGRSPLRSLVIRLCYRPLILDAILSVHFLYLSGDILQNTMEIRGRSIIRSQKQSGNCIYLNEHSLMILQIYDFSYNNED